VTLYARSDVASVTVPVESGGCGRPGGHSRPVINGAPAKTFKLDCPDHCEPYLRGDRKPKILKYHIDAKTGQTGSQERVADADPMWSSTPETVPLTPDQEKTYHVQIERGEQQLRALESLAALSKAGIDFRSRPDVLFYLREQELPENLLEGTLECANGHANAGGTKFCGECGMSMAARGAIAPPEEPEIDLDRIHPQTLKKMCREKGLPDKGSKDALIGRLQAAA
jgi:hypothetical protein